MFCSFDKSPRIMRWFCKGRVVEWDQPEYETMLKKMGKAEVVGARAVIVLDVWKGRLLLKLRSTLRELLLCAVLTTLRI